MKPTTNLEALLRDACRRALSLGLSFTNQIRAYRSIVALAREVRLRAGGVSIDTSGETLSTLLAAVCEHASELGLDPELPFPDAILMQRLAVQLSRAARQAGATDPVERQFYAQHPMHREAPPEQVVDPQDPMPPKASARPEAFSAKRAQYPLQREDGARTTGCMPGATATRPTAINARAPCSTTARNGRPHDPQLGHGVLRQAVSGRANP